MNEAELIEYYADKILEFKDFTLDNVPFEYREKVNSWLNSD